MGRAATAHQCTFQNFGGGLVVTSDAFTSAHRMAIILTAARSLKVVPITAPIRSDAEIETAIIALGHQSGGGLVVTSDAFTTVHRAPIILAAARNLVPAVFSQSLFARDGAS